MHSEARDRRDAMSEPDITSRWIAAGKLLATDLTALVPCPACGKETLVAEDIDIERSKKFERIMRCPKCGSRNILLLNKEV